MIYCCTHTANVLLDVCLIVFFTTGQRCYCFRTHNEEGVGKLIRYALRLPLSCSHAVFIMASDRRVRYVSCSGPNMLCGGSGKKNQEVKSCTGPNVLLWLRSSLLVQRCKYPLSFGKYRQLPVINEANKAQTIFGCCEAAGRERGIYLLSADS